LAWRLPAIGWDDFFSKQRAPWWAFGYILPLLPILLFILGRRIPRLEFAPPISWLLAGRTEFALSGFVTAFILTTPLSRLTVRRQRVVVLCFICGFCGGAVGLAFSGTRF
jgi:hypothetical protein